MDADLRSGSYEIVRYNDREENQGVLSLRL